MAPRRSASSRSLKRNVATRQPRKTLVVFCEGRRSEPEYIDALKRDPQIRSVSAVEIRVESQYSGSAPLTLVRLAAEAKRRAREEEGEVDEFWCVFDVEWPQNHPNLSAAIDQARANDINLAISNPCFEVWLIMHFRDQEAWLDNDGAKKIRRECDGSSDKGVDGAKYIPRRTAAATRAARMDKRHESAGIRFPDNNPSTGMYKLLASIEP